MWIITRGGFKSVVAYDPKHDDRKDSPFKKMVKSPTSHVLVRARAKEHLEDLVTVVPGLRIEQDFSADYMFRAVIPRKKWEKYLQAEAQDIDYHSHFKEVVRDASPADLKSGMYKAMMAVWSDMYALQPYTAPKGGKGSYYGGAGYGGSYYQGTTSYTGTGTHTGTGTTGKPVYGESGWEPDFYLSDAVVKMIERKRVSFTADEVNAMSTTAYEFYTKSADRFGENGAVTKDQAYALRDEVIAEADARDVDELDEADPEDTIEDLVGEVIEVFDEDDEREAVIEAWQEDHPDASPQELAVAYRNWRELDANDGELTEQHMAEAANSTLVAEQES